MGFHSKDNSNSSSRQKTQLASQLQGVRPICDARKTVISI
jgi:hypothetical protein